MCRVCSRSPSAAENHRGAAGADVLACVHRSEQILVFGSSFGDGGGKRGGGGRNRRRNRTATESAASVHIPRLGCRSLHAPSDGPWDGGLGSFLQFTVWLPRHAVRKECVDVFERSLVFRSCDKIERDGQTSGSVWNRCWGARRVCPVSQFSRS